MTEITSMFNLAPAGYLILEQPDRARLSSEYRQRFGQYAGVDRLPPLLPPDAAIREAIGEAPIQDEGLAHVIEEWFNSRFGNTAFIPTYRQARRLLKEFREFGFDFELAYCELALKKEEEGRLNAYAATDERPPSFSLTYGFDASWPTCNHSAILQPGVVVSTLSWRQKLNQYGLLDDYKDTEKLRREYLAVYPHPPFDVYLVHRAETK